MILRLTTVHENGSLEVTPVFSTKASAILIAGKDLLFFAQRDETHPSWFSGKRYDFCSVRSVISVVKPVLG